MLLAVIRQPMRNITNMLAFECALTKAEVKGVLACDNRWYDVDVVAPGPDTHPCRNDAPLPRHRDRQSGLATGLRCHLYTQSRPSKDLKFFETSFLRTYLIQPHHEPYKRAPEHLRPSQVLLFN
jgi:hypothetical protein